MAGSGASTWRRSTNIKTGGGMQVDLLEGMTAYREARRWKRQPAKPASAGQGLPRQAVQLNNFNYVTSWEFLVFDQDVLSRSNLPRRLIIDTSYQIIIFYIFAAKSARGSIELGREAKSSYKCRGTPLALPPPRGRLDPSSARRIARLAVNLDDAKLKVSLENLDLLGRCPAHSKLDAAWVSRLKGCGGRNAVMGWVSLPLFKS
ncbi:uncharacterized protein LDX57_003199 [Aspergillus melleus]|uniref:uncharacterized protein n=1 Tax=Aspergillus melleus TaxID=138277 RepID=UPI001E8EDA8D|nr:uncharacterized protein LDX57_003199 [Aspergillus melleus]KAH8425446.1 hypothetical protein LDX57_003199 [Aspergillus melleus]